MHGGRKKKEFPEKKKKGGEGEGDLPSQGSLAFMNGKGKGKGLRYSLLDTQEKSQII